MPSLLRMSPVIPASLSTIRISSRYELSVSSEGYVAVRQASAKVRKNDAWQSAKFTVKRWLSYLLDGLLASNKCGKPPASSSSSSSSSSSAAAAASSSSHTATQCLYKLANGAHFNGTTCFNATGCQLVFFLSELPSFASCWVWFGLCCVVFCFVVLCFVVLCCVVWCCLCVGLCSVCPCHSVSA